MKLVVMGAVALLILTVNVWRRHSRLHFGPPLMGLVCVFYLLAYGLGGVYYGFASISDVRYQVGADALGAATAAALIVVIGMALGAGLVSLHRTPRSTRSAEPADEACRVAFVLLYALGWLGRVSMFRSGWYFHTAFETASSSNRWILETISLLPLAVVASLAAMRGLSRGIALLLLLELAWALPQGSRESVLAIVLVSWIAIAIRGSIRWTRRALIVPAIAVLMLFPIIQTYRGDNPDQYQRDPIAAFMTSVSETIKPSNTVGTVQVALESVFSRFVDTISYARANEVGFFQDPQAMPFTPAWTLTSALPRAVFPDKPDPGLYGNEFGRDVGLLGDRDRSTSVVVGHPLELRYHFGWLGLFVGGLVLGSLLELANYMTDRQSRRPLFLGITSIALWLLARSPATILAQGFTGGLKSWAALTVFGVAALSAGRIISSSAQSQRLRGSASPPSRRSLDLQRTNPKN